MMAPMLSTPLDARYPNRIAPAKPRTARQNRKREPIVFLLDDCDSDESAIIGRSWAVPSIAAF